MTAERSDSSPPAGRLEPAQKAGARFWISAAVGWFVILIGVRGIFAHRIDTRPADLARFVVGGALIHDLVVAPLVILVAVVIIRRVRGRSRVALQVALIVTATVTLFSYPLVRAYGLAANNPTSLPRNYALNLTIVLGLVWIVIAAALVVRLRRDQQITDSPANDNPHGEAGPNTS